MSLEGDEGILTSLRYYDKERRNAQGIQRFEGSNVDTFTTSDGEDILLCHLSTILPFTQGNYKPILNVHEDLVSISLAAHHLNTGDGSIVPELAGLNERCKVRFTTEFTDTEYNAGKVLSHVVEQSNRELNSPTEQIPCAFIGASRSSISIPMSIVTGLFGYPQVSGSSTSVNLDDTSQFPLFGRTIPSDQGNAVPIIIYLSSVLNIKHLSVINVNDAYGNAYVDGLRLAAEVHAPEMTIHQIPLDDGQNSIKQAVASVKKVQYRFIFCIIFTAETHDALLTEAFREGVAGDGLHNWLFADSFQGELDGRVFPKKSPLHYAYRGVGLLEASGGVKGIPSYDNFVSKLAEIKNPTDLQYLGSKFPVHDNPNYPTEIPFINDANFLVPPIVSSFSPFYYEAAISLGLGACAASLENEAFSGREHFDNMLLIKATGVSGSIVFDETTGTRDPSSVLYKVTNFLEQDAVDPTTGEPGVEFIPTVTDLFINNQWNQQKDYIFNDGTANLPADLPPPVDDSYHWPLLIGIPACILVFVIAAFYFYVQHKKNQNDTVWKVKREELKFCDPPVIIGRGTFGLVLKAEYRGTDVAVKRVIPQKDDREGSQKDTEHDDGGHGFKVDGTTSTSTTDNLGTRSTQGGYSSGIGLVSAGGFNSGIGLMSAQGLESGVGKRNNTGFMSVGFSMIGGAASSAGLKSALNSRNQSAIRKRMRDEFISEMRYLSKLRHPCVTTVMGAVINKGEEPMLVMEYMDHGSLYDLLHNETMAIDGELLLPLLRDVSQGVRFLHSANPTVIHGDLKCANILVDTRFRAKVADFGLSQKKNLGGTGTPFWMAPELLREESTNTTASDVYSFGIILYEVYSRRDPYEGEDPREVLRLVADKQIRKRPPVPRGMPEKVKSLMADCVEEEPDKRPTFEELDMRLKRVDAENADPGFTPSVKPSSLSLFDIFPRHVAEALRDGRTVEPEHRDSVTIFFSDIVGFTNISAELEPRKVAAMLDRLYTAFDALSQLHDVFKVETIGDAYMAVTNLVKDQPDDHAKRIAYFAIDALLAANSIAIDEDDPDRGYVNIRVGFHSGPVVADVVGTRNPRYCLFGDTVNTASRMESNSKVNRIHCSRAAARLLHKQAPELNLKSRGKINIKGKGEMQTFWVNEGRDRQSLLVRTLESNRALSGSASSNARSSGTGNSIIPGVSLSKLETIFDSLDESVRSNLSDDKSGEMIAPLSKEPPRKKKLSETAKKMAVLKEDGSAGTLSAGLSEHDMSREYASSEVDLSGEFIPSEAELSGEISIHRPERDSSHSVSHWVNAVDQKPANTVPESAPSVSTDLG